MNVIPFQPTRFTRAKQFAGSLWKSFLLRFHCHYWQDETSGNIVDDDRDVIGRYYVQLCNVPGCGKRRKQKLL